MSTAQAALMNDDQIQDVGAVLIQEPYCFLNDDHEIVAPPKFQSQWTQLLPTKHTDTRYPIRSAIWINKNIKAVQVEVNSPDITAAKICLDDREILLASIYIPPKYRKRNEQLTSQQNSTVVQRRLTSLEQVISRQMIKYPHLELLIAGDFNTHHFLWGGDHAEDRDNRAEPILSFTEQFELSNLLPRGTITYESHRMGHKIETTIDLVFSSSRLAEELTSCHLWEEEYGSDHRAIYTEFKIDVEETIQPKRLLLKHAQWDLIRRRVQRGIQIYPQTDDIDTETELLVSIVKEAIEKHCPVAKPCPYAKRWWSTNLTTMRKAYTYQRNQLRILKRHGFPFSHQEAITKKARKEFKNEVKRQKRQHWVEFLDNSTNIWKVAKFLQPERSASSTRISELTTGTGAIFQDNDRIAQELIANFFPQPPEREELNDRGATYTAQLPFEPITKSEIEDTILKANPYKAAGNDELPMVVWKELWTILGDRIHHLLHCSLQQGKLPRTWKIAKIIPLRKANKPDYKVANAYRPISLLATLGKVLEAVIAERISYYVETNILLPKNHFGARKQRSTTQAITFLQEKVFDAWRGKNTVSLVTFDNKGAYNGVAKEPLLRRLRERRIPEQLVRWIEDFCTGRKASITVNGYTSETEELQYAGLPQGSPLSPILFLFFNANLVQKKFPKGDSMAFVDDYTAWIVGPSAEDNTRMIQETVIPELEKWEHTSGATFDAAKTQFMHLTRVQSGNRIAERPIQFKDTAINPAESIKLLGVIIDSKLQYKLHAARAAKRGYKAAQALRRLRSLRPATSRTLFNSTVCPVIDYACPAWLPLMKEASFKLLECTNRIGASAIVGAFKTTALPIAESEAAIEPVRIRLYKKLRQYWIRLHTLPEQHPLSKLRRREICKRYTSPLQITAGYLSDLEVENIETVEAFTRKPWARKPVILLHVDQTTSSEQVRENNLQSYPTKVSTGTSVRNGKAGIGVWMQGAEYATTVSLAEDTNSHLLALRALKSACNFITWQELQDEPEVHIYTTSKTALQAIKNSKAKSGRDELKGIYEVLEQYPNISFHWSPQYSKMNEAGEARKLARTATQPGCRPISQTKAISSISKEAGRLVPPNHIASEDRKAFGHFTRKIDQIFRGKHTRSLYDDLTKTQASILAQLRTGKNRLNTYLHRIKATETDLCDCGQQESVQHFLLTCQRWKEERQQLRREVTQRHDDISFLLGGYSGSSRDGEKQMWKPDLVAVRACIRFAQATGRLEFQQDGQTSQRAQP